MDKLKLLQGRNGQELKLVDMLAADWEQVAIQIGFQPYEVGILQRNHANDSRGACWKLFNEWISQNGDLLPPTWSSLYDVLLHVEYESAADQMKAILSVVDT